MTNPREDALPALERLNDGAMQDAALPPDERRRLMGVVRSALQAQQPFVCSRCGGPPVYSNAAGNREPTPDGERDTIAEIELGDWVEKVRDVVMYARAGARSKGYALAVHGTLRRDVDVVAIPWTEEACGAEELAEYLCEFLSKMGVGHGWGQQGQKGEDKPHGRKAWSIALKGIPAPYLDLSVAPRVAAALLREAQQPKEAK